MTYIAEPEMLRKKLVDAFLQRHGFAHLNDSRDMSGVYQVVRLAPACPVQVAKDVGNLAMAKMLMEVKAAGEGMCDVPSRRRGYAFS